MFRRTAFRVVLSTLLSSTIIICLFESSHCQWDCFNRRSWSYYGTRNWSCILTDGRLDCTHCETWTSVIGNWSNAQELIETYDLESSYCRVAGNTTAPWCYVINMNGDVTPGFCQVQPCTAHAACKNDTGGDYRGYGKHTESGYLCMDWENATDQTVNPTSFPEQGLDENFCRNPDRRDRPWCYYQRHEDSDILFDFCQIDDCTTSALSHFQQIIYARFNSYDDRVVADVNMTSEECALECLKEESFMCLSFKFRDVHTYNDRKCTLSSQSIYTLDLARTLPNPTRILIEGDGLHSFDNDMFTRIDKICDAFLPDLTQLPADCPLPLTMLVDNGRINVNISASSYMEGYQPDQAELESAQSWIPVNDTSETWLQICYSERVLMTGLVTRGNEEMMDGEGCWVNSFTMEYSLDGGYWWELVNSQVDLTKPIEFLANAEATCNTTTFLPNPLRTRCLRIKPVTWRNKICLSVSIIGCLDNDCDESMGLTLNRIHDNQIEASSWNGDAFHSSKAARVGYIRQVGYGWIPDQPSPDEWIQINFNEEKLIQGVVTQGCLDVEAWVESYTISYTNEIIPYRHDNGSIVVFRGNWDKTTPVRNDLETSFVTLLVRVHPVTWYHDVCIRLEFIGCQNRVCNKRLGMESRQIPNEAIQASTMYTASPGHNGRLYIEEPDLTPAERRPFWGPRGLLARNEWLQIDLSELHTVTGIITQGSGITEIRHSSWVTTYRLAYWSMHSTNGSETLLFYRDIEGNEMILPGNNDQNSEVRNTLDRPVITRRVRIMPYEWYSSKIRMRAEIVGCPLIGTGRVCASEKGLVYGGRCYASVSSNADGACSDIFAEGSTRATIKSSDIQKVLSDHVNNLVFESKTQLTIGATKEGENDWMWGDGTTVIYEQFLFDLPGSTCVALDGLSRFQWTQYQCQSTVLRGSLCEIDIDECLSTEHGCSHECVNIDGGYYCACPEGYRLDASRRKCVDICSTDIENPNNNTVINEGSSCYYVMDSEQVTWSEAANQCIAIQSRLANASDINFVQVIDMANVSDIWVEDNISASEEFCPSITVDFSELILGGADCEEQKAFLCEREYADLHCDEVWSDDVTSHVTSASVGHLHAYSYPPWYNEHSACNFFIKGPENMNVRLIIMRIKLRQDPNILKCQDTLGVYDVMGMDSQARGSYCGDINDIELIGRSNMMFIELTMWSLTANMPNELGFDARYDMIDCNVINCNAVCGETVSFHGPSGSFHTKDFPSLIPPFTNCEYYITVQSDEYISFHFDEFDIERERNSDECVDEVSIRTPSGVLRRALCGNTTQPLIISNSPSVIVALKTGLAGKSTGFNLVYNRTELGGCGFGRDTCSGVEYCSLPAAVFVSVNYPFPYSPNSQCRWSITTPEGSYVTITFLKFDVIPDTNDRDCTQSDFLIVYDGANDADSVSLGRFCNSNRPPSTIVSSANAVVVEFVSDGRLEGEGFYAEYRETYTEFEMDGTTDIEYTCPSGLELFGSKCYQFISINQTIRWNDASKMCRDIGAFLVSIKTEDEMNFIHYMLTSSWFTGNDMETYIGLTDIANEGHFRWEDGGPLSYADWYIADRPEEDSQPNGHEQEDCTMIKMNSFQSSANWHDISCASRETSQFICDQAAEANEIATPSIGDLSRKGCPFGSRRIGETCISLALTVSDATNLSPCKPIQSSVLLPLPRLVYVLSILWPFSSTAGGIYINIQGVYDSEGRTLSPRSNDVTTKVCHMMEYNGVDWQIVNRDCALTHNGNICYVAVSELSNTCGEDMFECMNGECIRSVHVCDGHDECTAGEDETGCADIEGQQDAGLVPSCPDSSFQCDMGICISASFYCDFVNHCPDESDEKYCNYPTCKDGEFECTNGQCIEASLQCDIIPDCVDGSDEELCQFCSGDTFQCYDGTCIPMRSVCDGSQDCRGLNMEDELSCTYNSRDNEDDTLRCLNGEILDARWHCLYDFDEFGLQQGCRDVTHLRDCGDIECFGNTFKCPNSYCLPLRRRCDSVADCPGGEDEMECELYSCPGFLRCHGQRYCVTDDQICDGVKDCPDGDDEMFCDIDCPSGCSCDGLGFTCDSSEVWTRELAASISTDARRIVISNASSRDRSKREIDRSRNETTIEDALFLNLPLYTQLLTLELPGNGIELIVAHTFTHQRNLKKLDLSRNNITKLYTDTFLGLNQLIELDLSWNPLMIIQPGAFNSLIRLPFLALQNLELTALERETFVGLESVDTINVADNKIERVESGAFDGLNYTRTLMLERNDLSQYKMDIFRGLDELRHLSSDLFLFCCIVPDLESCYPPEDQFSSCEDLMRSNVLRIFMWILGFSAFIGNIFVMIERMRGRKKFSVQSFLIFNLAISDCLMGIYMLIIASVDAHFRDVYVFHAEDWKASFMCKLAGILANLSSEVSVLILTTISIDRFLCITFPFSQKHLGRKSVRVAAALIWTASIIYSVIPALPFPYFGERFYGRSGVCLALPLTNDKPPGWKYAMSGIFINFIAMVTIIICYCFIYVIAKRSGSSLRRNKSMDAEIKLAVRTAVIVATDICCWLPIVILAFVSLSDSAIISPTVYAWIAVFVLPINSSINPYLYTISTINIKTRLASFRTGTTILTNNSNSSNRHGGSAALIKNGTKKHLEQKSSSERDSVASFEMNTRKPDRMVLSDAIGLIKANKLGLKVDDVEDIKKELYKILNMISACAMTHGSIDADHVVIQKNKETGKWTGSILLTSTYTLNGDSNNPTIDEVDQLGMVIAELNDALGYGATF